ncbi:MAG TPA: hypothetical protein VK194_06155 [Candidatus Deferrimicrobium sp.]|nr:hypothetical protein [Candidatus Deferrimicrobium sp.]
MIVPQLAPRRRIFRGIGLAVAATTLALAGAMPAFADGATVTGGDIHAFATSSDAGITGQASMVRTADGRTIVIVHVSGLAPDTTYGSHVHLQACANGNAGGHYRFDPAGPATPPNEIHLDFTTNAAGIGLGRAVVDATAGPTAVAVVVHAPGGAKIACADLS